MTVQLRTQLHDNKKHFLRQPLLVFTLLLTAFLTGCSDNEIEYSEEPIIRGLKAYRVSMSANTELRRYPSVVQPAKESKLSFEVSGKLKAIKLEVGQRVTEGDLLAEIDPVSLELNVEKTKASIDEAEASLRNARLNYDRQKSLLKKNYVTQSEFDTASSQLKSLEAQVSQLRRQLDLAREDLSKAQLISPFTGVISSIEVQDYGQVLAGDVILGLYSENAYEISFGVPATVINNLGVGDPVEITFADLPAKVHIGHIKELGSRARQVSVFPVVVSIDKAPEALRAGMAANVEVSIALANAAGGFLVPISSFHFDAASELTNSQITLDRKQTGFVYVYDEETQTVATREISFLGIRGNMAIVDEGIAEGDIVAAAGVSYLYDGQRVNLLPLD